LRALPAVVLVFCIAAISSLVARWALRRFRVSLRRARRTVARLPRAAADGSIVDLAAYRARREAHLRLVPRAVAGATRPGITVAPVAPVARPAGAASIEHLA
jgi:hypothetical protein